MKLLAVYDNLRCGFSAHEKYLKKAGFVTTGSSNETILYFDKFPIALNYTHSLNKGVYVEVYSVSDEIFETLKNKYFKMGFKIKETVINSLKGYNLKANIFYKLMVSGDAKRLDSGDFTFETLRKMKSKRNKYDEVGKNG